MFIRDLRLLFPANYIDIHRYIVLPWISPEMPDQKQFNRGLRE